MIHRFSVRDEILQIGEDELLCGALNAFISLPSFPSSFYFERDSNLLFEVTRYVKRNCNRHYQPIFDCTICDIAHCSKKKLVSKNLLQSCDLIDLAAFYQSSIYFSYVFIISLNPYLNNKITAWDAVVNFFHHLEQCDGFVEYLCWIDVFKSSSKESLNNIRLKYFRPNPINFISSVSYINNRGNLLESLVRHIASYWVPRLSLDYSNCSSDDIELRPINKEQISDCSVEELRQLLINVLSYESLSGNKFQNFLLTNKLNQPFKYVAFIKGCFSFYNGFSSETVDCLWANRSAWKIISTYLLPSSLQYVYFPPDLVDDIQSSSNPPYEDLFDGVVEYALFNLIPSLQKYILDYITAFESIPFEPIPEPVKYIPPEPEEVAEIEERPKEVVEEPKETEKPEAENLLATILRNRNEFERFKAFLNTLVPVGDKIETDPNPVMDLNCYIEIEKFKMTSSKQGARDDLAANIKQTYLTKKYFFGPPSPAPRNVQIDILGGSGSKMPARPPSPVIFKLQKHAMQRLNNKWVKQYKSSEEYQRRQDPAGSSLARRKGNENQQSFVFVDSKARANAHEMLQLRRTLLDPVKSAPFKRYAKAKNERFLRDIEFWIEVQKYKDMQHRHSSTSLIRKKIDTIIDCFLDSTVQPKVQISINTDIANRIAETRYEMGPYIFRKAQSIVTKVLIALWGEFNSWFMKHSTQISSAFQKLELDAEQKKLVKEMLKQKQKEEEKERATVEPVRSRANTLRKTSRLPSVASNATTDSFRPVIEKLEDLSPTLQWKFSDAVDNGREIGQSEMRRHALLEGILQKGMFKDDLAFREYLTEQAKLPPAPRVTTNSYTIDSKGKQSGSFDSSKSGISKTSSKSHRSGNRGGSRSNFDRTHLVSIHEKRTVPSRKFKRRAAVSSSVRPRPSLSAASGSVPSEVHS